jgi:predicted small secreted protein
MMRMTGVPNVTLRKVLLAIPSFLLFACATTPGRGVEDVQLVTAGQKERQCKSLGTFSVVERSGPDKPGTVLTKARSEVVRRGGNGLYVISSSVDWEQGAAVSAEALQCQF